MKKLPETEEQKKRARRWAILKIGLGQGQIVGAASALLALVTTGAGSELTVGAVVITCFLFLVSKCLFP